VRPDVLIPAAPARISYQEADRVAHAPELSMLTRDLDVTYPGSSMQTFAVCGGRCS
jgi:hypothetical protein